MARVTAAEPRMPEGMTIRIDRNPERHGCFLAGELPPKAKCAWCKSPIGGIQGSDGICEDCAIALESGGPH